MALLSTIIARGTYASRPAAGTPGALYYATDYGILYRDNGSSWDAELDITSLTADAAPDEDNDYGLTYDATDGKLKKVLLANWPGAVGDASDIPYTPAVLADWDGGADPGDVDDALDELAERVTDKEGPPACRVYHDAAQSCANASWVTLSFNSENFDTDTMHDTVTNNSRITATTAGRYLLACNIKMVMPGNSEIEAVKLVLNGSSEIAFQGYTHLATNWDNCKLLCSTVYDLSATDYVQVQILNYYGSAINTVAGETGNWFLAVRLGD